MQTEGEVDQLKSILQSPLKKTLMQGFGIAFVE
jgi:hypothetical protein